VVGFHAVHDAPGTMGFLVGSPDGGRLLYLTDSAYTPYTFDGLTHVAVEVNHDLDLMRGKTVDGQIDPVRYRRTVSNHMSLNRALDLLRAIDKRRLQEVWLLHLSDANSDEAAFKAAVQEVVGVPVHVAPRNILEVRK
jgi:phosphoribosyl 1,2-cyclic phosphodiesterase